MRMKARLFALTLSILILAAGQAWAVKAIGPEYLATIPPNLPQIVDTADTIIIGQVCKSPFGTGDKCSQPGAKPADPDHGHPAPYLIRVDQTIKGSVQSKVSGFVEVRQPTDTAVYVFRDPTSGLPMQRLWCHSLPDDPYAGFNFILPAEQQNYIRNHELWVKQLLSTPPTDFPGIEPDVYGLFALKKSGSGEYEFVDSQHPVLPALGPTQKHDSEQAEISESGNALVRAVKTLASALSNSAEVLDRKHSTTQQDEIVDDLFAVPLEVVSPVFLQLAQSSNPHVRLWAVMVLLNADYENAVFKPRWRYLEAVKPLLADPPADTVLVTDKVADWIERLSGAFDVPPEPGTVQQAPDASLVSALRHSKSPSIRNAAEKLPSS
jgi:hypothetical protein